MTESQMKMCALTINGNMYLVGGEDYAGYSVWKVSPCCFHVGYNYRVYSSLYLESLGVSR